MADATTTPPHGVRGFLRTGTAARRTLCALALALPVAVAPGPTESASAEPIADWSPFPRAHDPDPGTEALREELERIAQLSGGDMGISAVHLESGREVHLNGDLRFPMASTYKVPIAVELLRRVDRGEVDLEEMVDVEEHHHSPGSGTLSDLFIQPGVSLSLRNLTELMLLISDNTATDLVLEAAGGPEAVTAGMSELGFHGIRVDRSTLQLIADWIGIGERLPPAEEYTLEDYEALVDAVSDERREEAGAAFRDDLRDTATPRDMAELLAAVWQGEVLSEDGSELLRDMLERVRTGGDRIQGMLPPHATVANKTGTIGGALNDVGVVELPGDRGEVVVVAFIRDSDHDRDERAEAIAHASRAIYDFFALAPPDPVADGADGS